MNGIFRLKNTSSNELEYYFAPLDFSNKPMEIWGIVKINRITAEREVIQTFKDASETDTWGIMRFGMNQLLPKLVQEEIPEEIKFAIG